MAVQNFIKPSGSLVEELRAEKEFNARLFLSKFCQKIQLNLICMMLYKLSLLDGDGGGGDDAPVDHKAQGKSPLLECL